MKVKKYIITGLFAAFVGVLSMGAASCGVLPTDSDVKFEDWQATGTATASLGSIYKIKDRSIEDTDGNVHFYDITVKDSNGDKTVLIGGEFEVSDLGGYTIEYALTVGANDVRTRTVSLSVVDDTAPKISVSLPTGFVNETYTIPAISVSDLSGETVQSSYVLYNKADETKTPITVKNGKFKPTQKGTYALDITAQDSSGNTAKVTKEFGIRAETQENILENFDDESSLLNSINGADNQEWLETFEGRNGVLHIKGTDAEKTGYLFRFMRERDAYRHLPFDSITVSLYVPKYADLYQATTDGSGTTDWFGAQKGQWQEFTISDFDDWEYFFNGATSDRGGQIFWTWTKNTDMYIDEIRFAATPKIDFITEDYKVAKGSDVQVQAEVKSDARLDPYITVKSPSGAKVAYRDGKFTATETGWYTVKATVETAEWSYYDTSAELKILCLGNYVKVGDSFTDEDIGTSYLLSDEHAVGKEYTLPNGMVYDPIKEETLTQAVEISVTRKGAEVAVVDEKFTPTEAGVYTVTYTSGEYTTICSLYVVQATLAADELENFGTKATVKQARYGLDGQGAGKAVEWLPEFEGKAGVLKMNDNGSEAGYMVRIKKTYEEMKALSWDYIDVSIYLKSGDWLCWGYAVDKDMGAINPSIAWKKGQWTTLTIARTQLSNEENFLKALTGNTGAQIFWGWDIKDDVYIDSITFRGVNNALNDFADAADTSECLNGGNGVGSAATWLESYQGASGVLKVNDGGAMGGFYFKTTAISAKDLAALDWQYIEIKVWATNASWIMFYEQDLVTQVKAGEWTNVKLSRTTIEQQMPIGSFSELLTGGAGAQLFWGYDNMGDVYFDSIIFSK